jgi:glycosyltransferase involved in cell wall biosynthesis
MTKPVYLRITTVPESLEILLEGQPEFLREHGLDVHLASSGQRPKRLENFKFYSIPFTRTINPLADIKAIWSIIKVLRNIKPDIIHSHTPKAGLISMLAGRICGIKIRLHTVAGLPQNTARSLTKTLLNMTEFITYTCAHKIYFNSLRQMESQKKAFPIFRNKMQIILNGTSNGIDTNRFRPIEQNISLLKKYRLDQDVFTWMFIGRVHEDKGINELIEAFVKFEEEYNGKSQLVIVGGIDSVRNSINQTWLKRIQEKSPSISFVGFQSNIPEWLSIANSLIFPSYREGFPNVPLQAACMGIPIIATDINGCNEIIKDGLNGFLVPTRDSNSIYEKMLQIFNSAELRISMGNESLATLPKKYNRKDFHSALLKEYQNLLLKDR